MWSVQERYRLRQPVLYCGWRVPAAEYELYPVLAASYAPLPACASRSKYSLCLRPLLQAHMACPALQIEGVLLL